MLSNSPPRPFPGQSRRCTLPGYSLRPSADLAPRPGFGSASLWAPRSAPGKKPVMKLPPAPANLCTARFLSISGASLSEHRHRSGLRGSPVLCVWRSRLLPGDVWLPSPFACSSGCLQCSVYLKYRRVYPGSEFLCAMTRLCKNLHLPAKTRKHLQLANFFSSVSELKLLINRRRYHSHNSS